MKHLKHSMGVLAIMATLLTFNFEDSSVTSSEDVLIAETSLTCVSDQAIINYLNGFGYTVFSVAPITRSSCHRRCNTQNSYDTIVYVEGGQIIGHSDDLY